MFCLKDENLEKGIATISAWGSKPSALLAAYKSPASPITRAPNPRQSSGTCNTHKSFVEKMFPAYLFRLADHNDVLD